MKWDKITDEQRAKEIRIRIKSYEEKFPGIYKFVNKDWLEAECESQVILYINVFDALSDEQTSILLDEQINELLEKLFIKADIRNMKFKERIDFWDNLNLNPFSIYSFATFKTKLIPRSYEEKVMFVSYFWNKAKQPNPTPQHSDYSVDFWEEKVVLNTSLQYDFELYQSRFLKKINGQKSLSFQYSLIIENELKRIEYEKDKYTSSHLIKDEVQVGYWIALNNLDDYLFRLYCDETTPNRIYGYVYCKKLIFLNELKEGNYKPTKVEKEPLHLINVWLNEDKKSYDDCIDFLKKVYPIIDSAFIVKDPDGRIRWCKKPSKGWVQYLRGFLYMCIQNKYIGKGKYSGGDFLKIVRNTFKVTPHKDSFINMDTPPDEEYIKPFVNFFNSLK